MPDERFRILLISDDAELGQRFVAECARQTPDLQVECEHRPEQALARIRTRREAGSDTAHYLLVVDLGPEPTDKRASTPGARFMAEFDRSRLIGTRPVVTLAADAKGDHGRWSSKSLLVSIHRDRIPAAVAQARLMAGHLWSQQRPSPAELCVLIVDDDPVDLENIRRHVRAARSEPWRILTAQTGTEALRIARQQPLDLVFLDYRLPDCSGAQLLRMLRIDWARRAPPVVSLTGAGSEQVAREMFLLGAIDYVRKELLNSSVVARYLRDARRIASTAPKAGTDPNPPVDVPPGCIAICGSAGATEPLIELLDLLSLDPQVAVLIALHLPPSSPSRLATTLQLSARMPLAMAEHGRAPTAGEIHLCPPGFDVGIVSGRYVLVESHQLASVPSLDVLLDSLARAYSARVAAVILSGLGQDGCRGATEVAAAGGTVLTIKRDTTEFPAMVDAVLATGCVHFSGTPSELAGALQQRYRMGSESAD
jgi:two-component system chemotaxis response regulator CheB